MGETIKRLAVDMGGTFTDIVLELGDIRSTLKLLTTHDTREWVIFEGLQELLDNVAVRNIDPDHFVHGTTLATNALIERKGAKTALIMTEGFRDTLEIADESRYDQYNLMLERPAPLVSRDLRFIVPKISQSNETDNRGRITKRGNKLMRTTRVLCTLVAIRYSDYLNAFYQRIREWRGSGKAIIATARKLVPIIYDM